MIPRHLAEKLRIVEILKDIFADHIGLENSIDTETLFYKITGKRVEDVEFYQRAYKWNQIKRILSLLRKEKILFVVMGTSHHYVLDSDEELENYKNKSDATIKGMIKMKEKATLWVKSQDLKKLKAKAKEKKKKKETKVLNAVAKQN